MSDYREIDATDRVKLILRNSCLGRLDNLADRAESAILRVVDGIEDAPELVVTFKELYPGDLGKLTSALGMEEVSIFPQHVRTVRRNARTGRVISRGLPKLRLDVSGYVNTEPNYVLDKNYNLLDLIAS